MLRLPPFDFRNARSAAEAVDLWGESEGRAMFVAGGTDLIPNMKRRQFEPPVLVGIRRLEGGRDLQTDDGLELGAGVTLRQLAAAPNVRESYPGLAEAAGQVANLQIQRVGTIGGNLCVDTRCNYYNQTYEWRRSVGFCMKKDGDICLVAPGSSKCWAISSSDSAPILMALGATVDVLGTDGPRTISLGDMYQDDGIEYLTLKPGELMTAVRVPAPGNGQRSTYVKVRRRGSFDFPILGVGASLRIEDGRVRDARLVLGAVHTHPLAVTGVSELMEGETPTLELCEAAAELAYKRATPLDNADLVYYWRKQVTRVHVRRALARLCGLEVAPGGVR
ncbi:MAG: 4-hydroxybenzoyl-CoA reductase [Acidobacteria bacterium]|nr:4-hydroxybenzoyl-CoA reductase [Acidobacteriota bacterium]